MHYTEYDVSFGVAWSVSMRIEDMVYFDAKFQNDPDSQESIIMLFQRECRKKYHGKRPVNISWNDKSFTLIPATNATPIKR